MEKFSIVTPIHNEVDLIPRTLPYLYSVGASEVILCLDWDVSEETLACVWDTVSKWENDTYTEIVYVKRDPSWTFHQANVRRMGFERAEYDKILTTDIDLLINRNVRKAVKTVGENDVGLCSLTKIYYPHNLTALFRQVTTRTTYFIRNRFWTRNATTFTGLYALYRPYWKDSEPLEVAKKLTNPRQKAVIKDGNIVFMGEDTLLRDCMVKKHRVVYLKDMGAICLTDATHNRPENQFEMGRYNHHQGKRLRDTFLTALIQARPYLFLGHFKERKKERMCT